MSRPAEGCVEGLANPSRAGVKPLVRRPKGDPGEPSAWGLWWAQRRLFRRWGLALLLSPACTPGPEATVRDAVEIGTLKQSGLVTGRDGAQSAQLWGHEVWAFGDTFLSAPNASGMSLLSNSFAFSATQVDGELILTDRLDQAGAPEELLQPTAEEAAFDFAHLNLSDGGCNQLPCGARWATWPSALVFDNDAGTGLVFYSLQTAAPGNFNFEYVGQSISVWSSLGSLPIRATPALCPANATLLFCDDEPGFGAAAVTIGSDVFALACPQDGLSFHCQLGKVALADALSRTAWLFWTGDTWSANLAEATTVFDGASILGVFFDGYLKLWVAVYAAPLGNEVVFRTAPDITGPWSAEGDLFAAQHGNFSGWTYDALPHPELSEQNGKVFYVTYSRPTSAFGSEFALVRVELK